jgi:NADPH2:quinone reductase
MVKAIVAERAGLANVLELKEITLKPLKSTEVLIRQEAIGLNFIDISRRRGSQAFEFPGILGCEAAGTVEAVGTQVTDFKVGDRIAYATAPSGAYSEKRNIDQKYLVPLPNYVSFKDAVAILLKGMTAHYLLRRTFFVTDRNTILVYAAAGGVGQFLCKLAMHYNASVIAVVGSEEKKKKVSGLGVPIVIDYSREDVLSLIKQHTNDQGVNVVYDSIGRDTFATSLACLGDFGLMVSFGSSSGSIPAIDLEKMSAKCLFLTLPNLFVYKKSRPELLLSANEVFALFKQRVIVPDIFKTYNFSQIKEAHDDIESRKTYGQCILIPAVG